MERILFIAGVVLLLAICGLIGFSSFSNPVEARQKWLEGELAAVKPVVVEFPRPDWDFGKWHRDITGKVSLWQEIVPPPPPPPKKAPEPPNIQEKLQGVEVTRQQVGQRVKIKTPDDQRGSFYAIGDTINGLQLKEINRKQVIFSVQWMDKELTTTLDRD